jgi:diadenylate cyclase
VADTGTMLDAQLTEPLIENIFYKGSPLHDGAVILRGNRILAAGCVLPLTENPNLSKDLGTRHRAGIGMTEVSDALVLIVSEETGIISMAKDGNLSRFLDLKAVEKALLNLYISKKPDITAVPRAGFSIFRKGGSDE